MTVLEDSYPKNMSYNRYQSYGSPGQRRSRQLVNRSIRFLNRGQRSHPYRRTALQFETARAHPHPSLYSFDPTPNPVEAYEPHSSLVAPPYPGPPAQSYPPPKTASELFSSNLERFKQQVRREGDRTGRQVGLLGGKGLCQTLGSRRESLASPKQSADNWEPHFSDAYSGTEKQKTQLFMAEESAPKFFQTLSCVQKTSGSSTLEGQQTILEKESKFSEPKTR